MSIKKARASPSAVRKRVVKRVCAEEPAVSETRSANGYISLSLSPKPLTLWANRKYSQDEVRQVLSIIHPGYFSSEVIEYTLGLLRGSGGKTQAIDGYRFVQFLARVDGLITLDTESGQSKIKSLLGISHEKEIHDIELALGRTIGNTRIYSIPEISPRQFVLRKDLKPIAEERHRKMQSPQFGSYHDDGYSFPNPSASRTQPSVQEIIGMCRRRSMTRNY